MRSPTTIKVPVSRAHRLQITLAVISCALTVAACGSASKPRSTTGGESGSFVRFAVCMRSHGVPSFPDSLSSAPGGGVSLVPPDVNTASPAFKTAWSACDKLLPGIGRHQRFSAQSTAQMLKFSECMRGHGVPGFPDPTPTPPAGFPTPTPPAGSSGYSMVVRSAGAYLAVPATLNPASPVYKQAAAACRFGPAFS